LAVARQAAWQPETLVHCDHVVPAEFPGMDAPPWPAKQFSPLCSAHVAFALLLLLLPRLPASSV
jgi:hypothetical protein